MTISVSVKVNDGLVFASDSATTMIAMAENGPPQILNVYNHANKIFNLCKGLPVSGMTHGAGSIGKASISTLAKDLRRRFAGDSAEHHDWKIDTEKYTMSSVAERVKAFFIDEHYTTIFPDPKTGPEFGFWIGGYSSDSGQSELWTIEVGGGKEPTLAQRKSQELGGIDWAGQPETINRLLLGHGMMMPDVLKKMGVSDAEVSSAVGFIQQNLSMNLCSDPMPIQDAIDLAEFLVDATIKVSKFGVGASTVGGPIEIAAITKHEGFKWVKRKHYFHESLNGR